MTANPTACRRPWSAPRAQLALPTGLALIPGPAAQNPRAILGHWEGRSVCVEAPWNSACNNEDVVYSFVPAKRGVLLHASKIVAGRPEPMYDLEFTYAAARGAWDGDFANARVRIRWTYEVSGDTLVGQVVMLPSQVVGRHVVAWRETSEKAAAPGQ